jgi:hypothetical protein
MQGGLLGPTEALYLFAFWRDHPYLIGSRMFGS